MFSGDLLSRHCWSLATSTVQCIGGRHFLTFVGGREALYKLNLNLPAKNFNWLLNDLDICGVFSHLIGEPEFHSRPHREENSFFFSFGANMRSNVKLHFKKRKIPDRPANLRITTSALNSSFVLLWFYVVSKNTKERGIGIKILCTLARAFFYLVVQGGHVGQT